MATPRRLRLRNHATKPRASGATIIAMMSLPPRISLLASGFQGGIVVEMVSFQSTGDVTRSLARFLPHQRGTRMPSTTSNWVTPSVATIITMRDAWRKRRTIAISTTRPSSSAISTPAPRPMR